MSSIKAAYDTSVLLYCAGEIGYRWAVKVVDLAAKRRVNGVADAFLIQEVAEAFWAFNDSESLETTFSAYNQMFQEVLPVTERAFERSEEIWRKYPDISPRLALRIAVMLENGIENLCSTYAAGMEHITEVKRANFMEELKHEQA